MTTTKHIVIYGILGDKPYRSKHRYTPEQMEEIRDITDKTAESVLEKIAPNREITVTETSTGRDAGG